MARLKKLGKIFFAHPARPACVISAIFFLWLIAGFYLPGGKGFTAFLRLGDKMSATYIPELRDQQPYVETDSYGYDGQSYVQIAMRPQLDDPALLAGVDNLAYRARRILFCWTAYLAGGGDAGRAMHAFALQNMVCWLVLAVVLLRWFPMCSWDDYVRWTGVMFSFGLFISVTSSLTDGPSLLLIAGGMALSEMGFPWWSSIVLAVSGLGKETNILAGVGSAWPKTFSWPEVFKGLLRGLLIVAPLVVWCIYLAGKFGWGDSGGTENITWPMSAYFKKWQAVFSDFKTEGLKHYTLSGFLMMISLSVHFLFFAIRWDWKNTWWRVGAAFAVLMACLGNAVWEGFPGAASRVLLPLALAFNVLVPRGRAMWLVVLLLGNLTAVSTLITPMLPSRPSYEISAVPELAHVASGSGYFEVGFDGNWYGPERSRWEYWRWSKGTACVQVSNPHAFTVIADISFDLRSRTNRHIGFKCNEQLAWEGMVASKSVFAEARSLMLKPGVNVLKFETSEPAMQAEANDARLLAFSVRNLVITIVRKPD